MKKFLFYILFIPGALFCQEDDRISELLVGHWEGAFIRSNAFQSIEIDFSEKGGKIFGLQIMDEWHPTFGEFEVAVEIDSVGQISFGTGYGKASLRLDKKNLEVNGQIIGQDSIIYLHLKKAVRPPKPNHTVEEVSIPSADIELYGHLHLPFLNPTKTAIVIVGGRGCYPDDTEFNLYAKFFRQYGIATLAYQKRGTGKSSGNCDLATITNLANDLKNAKSYLNAHPNDFENIGVLGISAGGWTMAKAQESADFDFMISVVGPSTSVREQQIQSADYGSDFYKLSEKAKENLIAYTNLLFDVNPHEKGFDKLNELLSVAESEGWNQLLEPTDIPKSEADIPNLWVRRHNYDPKEALHKYENPYLAIYGERDWIVPYRENIELLKEYFKDNLDNLSTISAYNSEHGLEMEAKWIELEKDQRYWHFYRISPEVRIALVEFLEKHELIK